MIIITDKTKCSGCGACAQVCPQNCINMTADNEGFLYPYADAARCVKCGLCLKVCPILNNKPQNKVAAVYGASAKDQGLLSVSSSGGMFSLIADYVFERGGVVFGAAFDENFKVAHNFVDNKEDLDALRRSKYVQSETADTFQKSKEFLQSGRLVLFTGVSCQIAGLKNYLCKEYQNLYTADLICHSVTSPEVWEKYLKENFISGAVKINFRDKTFGWEKSGGVIYLKDGKELPLDTYLLGFGGSLYGRPSCHKCAFKGAHKYADFTMADFWGVQKAKPELYNKNGVSLLTLNSQKAQKVFEEIKRNMNYAQVNLEEVVRYNPCFYKSRKPSPKRAEFFARFQKEPLNGIIKTLTKESFFKGKARIIFYKLRALLGR